MGNTAMQECSICPGLLSLLHVRTATSSTSLSVQFVEFDEICSMAVDDKVDAALGEGFYSKWLSYQRGCFPHLSPEQQSKLPGMPGWEDVEREPRRGRRRVSADHVLTHLTSYADEVGLEELWQGRCGAREQLLRQWCR